jgi:hypothetical protein
MATERLSLLASNARVQAPWVKVSIGQYTFGVFSKTESKQKDDSGFYYTNSSVQYPNYIQRLEITKINGQVNQYTLSLTYPVTQTDDPNFFEKVLSSVSKTRKIIFSYGDMSMPAYIYRNEEAIITKVKQNFNIKGGGEIAYTISAVSSAALSGGGSWTFQGRKAKPSDVIKQLVRDTKYGLRDLFTGMNLANLDRLIAGDDKEVTIGPKRNISPIDYISYLVSCMMPASFTVGQWASTDIYILTLHDDTTYDQRSAADSEIQGSYFKVERISYKTNQSDAFQIDIGFGNTGTIVTEFSVTDDENYALLYEYNTQLDTDPYVTRIDNNGQSYSVYAPTVTSKNDRFMTRPEDLTWWTKMTKYPIKATITVQGLLRPAILMSHIRLNVIYPGGRKHISSGLYLVTQQRDVIDGNGYRTTLNLAKISGDDSITPY